MAIVFNKTIDVNRLNLAFNNNILEYYSNALQITLKSEIIIGSNVITLFPSPSGVFFYNLKNYIVSLINTDNYTDDLQPDLLTSYVYDWTGKIILNEDIEVKIYLGNDTTESTTITPYWLSGYVQLRDYKKTYPLANLLVDNIFLLAPTSNTSNTSNYVKYWYGLPFDLSLWMNEGDIDATNNSNALSYTFTNNNKVARLVFSDGDTTTTLEDVLPLQTGFNTLNFNNKFELLFEKVTNFCEDGHYFKWINRYGGWSYWLFNKGVLTRTTKSLGNLSNDFNNLEDTISPAVSLGTNSDDVIQIVQESITEKEFTILEDILDSAKVYLFTGIAFSQNTFNDWMEVNIKNGNFKIQDSREKNKSLSLSIELPQRVTRTL